MTISNTQRTHANPRKSLLTGYPANAVSAILLSMFLCSGCAPKHGTDEAASLTTVLCDANLTRQTVAEHLFATEGFDPQMPDVPANEIEAAYRLDSDGRQPVFEGNTTCTARHPTLLPNAVLLVHKTEDAVTALTFSKNGHFIESLLLRYGTGNNEFKIERDYTAYGNTFNLTDKHFDTEWISFPTQGKTVLQDEKHFTITVDRNGHFHR